MGDRLQRGIAVCAHIVGLTGVGMTIWDLYEVRFWPSARTIAGFGVALLLAAVGWRLGQIAWGHTWLAVAVYAGAQILWLAPWVILHFAVRGTVTDVSAFRYFRLLALPTVLVGLVSSVLLLEGLWQALAGKRLSLRLTTEGDYGVRRH